MSVDTLSRAKELRAADFATPQAEAIAAAIGRSVSETTATKADLSELRAAGKADVLQLGTALRGEISNLGADLRTEIERSRNATLTWVIGAMFAIAGLAVAAVKLIPA